MTDNFVDQPSENDVETQNASQNASGEGDRSKTTAPNSERVMDVRDLVYSGGFDKDPQEILGNPAVAPEMLQEGRDLRVDLFRDADDADPEHP
jgi:hypothetical protein